MKQETTKNKIVTINGKRGEYTGFSNKTVKHHFSMYDGSTVALSELETIRLFGVDFVTPSHTYNQPKDESKEVKEGGELFTKGEWAIIGELQNDKHMCPVPYYEIGSKDSYYWTAHVNASPMSNNDGEAEANAALIIQAPAMYKLLKEIENTVPYEEEDIWEDSAQARQISELFERLKEVLKKANPNY